jgi:hypothetical protein
VRSSDLGSARYLLIRALEGHLTLQFVVFSTIVLFWITVILIAFMLLLRLYYHLRREYLDRRRKLYEPAIALALMEEPREKIMEALRPRRLGDMEVVENVILDSIRHLTGTPFSSLQAAAFKLGIVERNLKRMHSKNKLQAGQGMEALGIMRAPQAVVAIISLLPKLRQDMKLVALRALALVGDNKTLPYFMKSAGALPPAVLPRLASLMLEFGSVAIPYITKLVNQNPGAFPPRIMKILLAEEALAEALQ